MSMTDDEILAQAFASDPVTPAQTWANAVVIATLRQTEAVERQTRAVESLEATLLRAFPAAAKPEPVRPTPAAKTTRKPAAKPATRAKTKRKPRGKTE